MALAFTRYIWSDVLKTITQIIGNPPSFFKCSSEFMLVFRPHDEIQIRQDITIRIIFSDLP